MLAALTLGLLGVSDDDIAADYALSRAAVERWAEWFLTPTAPSWWTPWPTSPSRSWPRPTGRCACSSTISGRATGRSRVTSAPPDSTPPASPTSVATFSPPPSPTPPGRRIGSAPVDLRFSSDDEAFRAEVAEFLRRRSRPASSRRCGAAAVRATSTPCSTSGWPGSGTWGGTAGRASAWPKEHGGRGLSLHQQVIFHEEYARAGGPGRVGHIGETLIGPTIIAFGSDEQQRRFLPPIRRRRRAVVPGLLRARRRVRPGQPQDPGRARRRRVGDRRPEGVDVARPVGAVVLRAGPHRPGGAPAPAASRTCWCRWTSPASRSGPSTSSPATPSSTRCSSPAPGRPRPTWSAACTRAGGGHGHARLRAGRVDARPAADVRQRARPDPGHRRGRTAPRRPGRPPAPGRRVVAAAAHAVERAAHAVGRARRPPRAQAVLGDAAPRHGRAGDGRVGRCRPWSTAPTTPLVCSVCSCSAGPTPSTPAPTRSSATSSASGRWGCRGAVP